MSQAPSDDDLRAMLETGQSCRVVHLARRPHAYRTSYPLEEVDVVTADGRSLGLVFKNLSRQGLDEKVRRVKPAFLHDPRREIEVYRHVLAPGAFGAPQFYGGVVDPDRDRYWLLIERIDGRELYQEGDLGVWQQAARWLAALHTSLAAKARFLAGRARLLVYDEGYYRQWPKRALQFQAHELQSLGILERVFAGYDSIIARLSAMPPTILHGEYYASNVLVQDEAGGLRICPVDWEMAALGPGLIDLAALISGKWTDEEKANLAMAYHEELGTLDAARLPRAEFLESLDYCRLHLAMQWLGWVDQWEPPAEHAHDWRSEAERLAEKLGF